MRVRFQVDADLDARIVRGLRRRKPDVDFQTAEDASLEGLPDPDVLRIAAGLGRLLVTHDRRTMPGHFAEFTTNQISPGVIITPKFQIGVAIEELLLIWADSEAEEWYNRLVWIPL